MAHRWEQTVAKELRGMNSRGHMAQTLGRSWMDSISAAEDAGFPDPLALLLHALHPLNVRQAVAVEQPAEHQRNDENHCANCPLEFVFHDFSY
jgi:hypothetical protein